MLPIVVSSVQIWDSPCKGRQATRVPVGNWLALD